MNTSDLPLAAYCSHGDLYETFLTSRLKIVGDVDFLLGQYGVPEAVRCQIVALFKGGQYPFDEGFRFESANDSTADDRTVVYASLPNSFIDHQKQRLPSRDASTAAWRVSETQRASLEVA